MSNLKVNQISTLISGAPLEIKNPITISVDGSPKMVVTDTGNVGIAEGILPINIVSWEYLGTKGSAPKLFVQKYSGEGIIDEVARFCGGGDSDGGAGQIRIGNVNDRGLYIEGGRIGDNATATPYGKIGTTSNDGVKTPVLTLRSGRLGVGTSTPLTTLHVNGESTLPTITGQTNFSTYCPTSSKEPTAAANLTTKNYVDALPQTRAYCVINGRKNPAGSVNATNNSPRQFTGVGIKQVTRVVSGLYRVDFTVPTPHANYAVHLSGWNWTSGAGTMILLASNITSGGTPIDDISVIKTVDHVFIESNNANGGLQDEDGISFSIVY